MMSPLLTDAMLGEVGAEPEWNRKVTMIVELACANDIYEMDRDTNLPADPDTLNAMQEAAMEQCRWWTSAGVDPIAGLAGLSVLNIAESSIGGASIKGNSALAASQDAEKVKSLGCLVPDAARILQLSGLATRSIIGGLW